METCAELELPPDINCIVYGSHHIEELLYTKVGKPIIVPAGVTTATVRLGLEIARRLSLVVTDEEKIYSFPIKKGVMPFSSPAYKTDPHRNVKAVSEIDTQMKIEWDDYRNNDEIYDYYSKMNDGRSYLVFARSGKKLIGGTQGIVGGFTSNYGILEDANFQSRFKAEFTWVGNPVPPRVSIP